MKVKCVIVVTVLIIFCSDNTDAQDWRTSSVDEIFQLARRAAFDGDHDESQAMLKVILERNPQYHDARILSGRTYAWDGSYDLARNEFNIVLQGSPENEDALSALSDVEIWDSQFEVALSVVDNALSNYPSSEDFLYKKGVCLKELGRDKEASAQLSRLITINPSHLKAQSLLRELIMADMKYAAGVCYNLDLFNHTYDPAHYFSTQVARNNSWGSSIVRVNHSQRFGLSGIQPEVDLYPRITSGVYAYVNYGYSNSVLFPRHRIGGEIFAKLPNRFETSAGMRYLNFGADGKITILTGSLGWYHKNYWLSVRPYLRPLSAGSSFATTLNLRKYLKDGENFIGFTTGIGFSPDERSIQSAAGLSTDRLYALRTQHAGASWQKTLVRNYILNISVHLIRQELSFELGEYAWITSSTIGIRKRF